MLQYDFKILQFNEFECLCRDLLQKKENNFIESFTEGRDDGIDLRFAYSKSHKTIIQVKRYKDYSTLIPVLKKEVEKVRKLNPKRYILMTSVGLTPRNKEEIYKLFSPYVLQESDIYGRDDINNLLGLFPEIEKQYYKLWLSSYNILQELINKKLVNYTSFELENIYDEIHRYVHNNSFTTAIDILNKNRIVIISGIPGIGKTTLARMLAYYLLTKGGYEAFVAISGNIDDGVSMFQDGIKQVFYYDDFLGSNTFIQLEKNFDKKLINLINAIKRRKDKILILTTREYILNDARQHYQSLNTENLDLLKCVVDLQCYTKYIRAKILYNHIADAHLPTEYIEDLIKGNKYLELVNHSNFNPRVIEFYIDKGRWKDVKPNLFLQKFKEFFDKPYSVWDSAFNDLSKEARYMLFILSTTGKNVSLEDWQIAYNYFAKNTNLNLSLDEHDWNNNLKILENSFVKTIKVRTDEIIIDFINPSVLDFISLKLKEQNESIKLLLQHCYFVEQLYTMFSEQIVPFYNWYCVQIEDYLYEYVLNSFVRLFKNIHSCSRVSYINTYPRKYVDQTIFLNEMRKEYMKLCNKEHLIEKTIKEELLTDSTRDLSTRLELINSIQWEYTNIDKNKILDKIGNEDMSCSDFSKYIQIINKAGLYDIQTENFIKKVYDTANDEIENLNSTYEANRLNDSLEDIFNQLDDTINKENLMNKLESKINYLEEIESEQTETIIEDDNIYKHTEIGEDEQIIEMFTSLRCE